MDSYFFALGLKRGSSESEMKKAYHKKALEYHPDRNPSGVEIFKRIQQAYEALQKHYKAHGGLDIGNFGTGGVSSSSTGRSAAARDDLDDLFTELQRSTSSTARRYPHRPPRQAATSSSCAGEPPTFDETHGKAEEARRRAHGPRVPVSAYDPFHGEEDQMDAFVSQAQHFAAMERRKAQLAANTVGYAGDGTAKGPPGFGRGAPPASSTPAAEAWTSARNTGVRAPASTAPPSAGGASPSSSTGAGPSTTVNSPLQGRRKPEATSSHVSHADASPGRAAVDVSNGTNGVHCSNAREEENPPASYKPCHQQLSSEWRQMRREAEEERRNQQNIEETARKLRKEQIERETREEWQRLQAEMETKKPDEWSSAHLKESMEEALKRVEQQRRTNAQLRELHNERRELKKELFSRRMPGEGELTRMSDQELFVLEGVLEAALSRVQSQFRSRMRSSAPCSACGIAMKDTFDRRFACEHRATCTSCGRSCFACPLCGADSLDLLRDE